MRGEYVPSFGRPDPQEPLELDDLEDEDEGNGLGQVRVALIPVLDPEAAARVEEQIRLMIAQAWRDGIDQAMAEMHRDR